MFSFKMMKAVAKLDMNMLDDVLSEEQEELLNRKIVSRLYTTDLMKRLPCSYQDMQIYDKPKTPRQVSIYKVKIK